MTSMTGSSFFSLQKGTVGRTRLVYAGLLAGLLLPGLNAVAGAYAWLGRSDADPVLRAHADNQFQVFWKSLVYVLTGLVLTYYLFGVLIIMAAIVCYVLRLVRGLQALARGEPPENPDSWLF